MIIEDMCLSAKIQVFFTKGLGQGLARLEWGMGQASKWKLNFQIKISLLHSKFFEIFPKST